MAEADIQAIIDTPNGDTSWGADLRGAMTTVLAMKATLDNDVQVALSGASITGVAAAVNDELLMQDTSNASALRTVTPADLMDVWVSTGTGTPGATPFAEGQIYIDTAATSAYISTGTSSSADWLAVDSNSFGTPSQNVITTLAADGAVNIDWSNGDHHKIDTDGYNITGLTETNGPSSGFVRHGSLFIENGGATTSTVDTTGLTHGLNSVLSVAPAAVDLLPLWSTA